MGKHLVMEGIKQVSPTAGKIASAMEQIESAASNPANYIFKTGLSKGFGAAGGGLATILMNPTEIANDPMEGGYGAMLDNERHYHNHAIDLGDAMGPQVPSEDIRRIVDAEIDDGQARVEAERKKKAERDAFGISDLLGLISNIGVGIH